jgi:8-oxo-dGTP pyrophosphatase MutT (NUDIX family)
MVCADVAAPIRVYKDRRMAGVGAGALTAGDMSLLLNHIARCHNARLPGARWPFRIGAAIVGWVLPEFAAALLRFPAIGRDGDGLILEIGHAGELWAIGRSLAEQGVLGWRDEAFDVRAEPGGPVLAQLDRGALPAFGVWAEGVHVNGLVRGADGLRVWVGRRAAEKAIDPGKLDHIVAGGIPAGLSAMQALVKEAAEEAGVPAALAAAAVPVGRVGYTMERLEGLRRDLLYCYDLTLPPEFVPIPTDGEVAAFELWPLRRVYETVAGTDDFKFNVNLVLIDQFLRIGLIDPESAEGRTLRRALDAPTPA